ncbi:MAG TPA: acyltransferase family protein [Jatrophihabitantaceae bacterium]
MTTTDEDVRNVDNAPSAVLEPKVAENRVKHTLAPGRGLSGRRLGGVDGLRAIAVLSVVLFHLDFSLAPGGFLGVDVFFVISGFLITNLLASEILASGRLRLGRFYLRRARRLLPTVFVVLAVVIVAATTLWRDQLATLRGSVVSSLAYVTNWWLIAAHESYFTASGRPPMLQQLWSLAIEEQFYIVWSVVVMAVAGVLFATSRRSDPVGRMRRLVVIAAGLALASALAMAYLAVRDGLPYDGSTSRVYYGSDTHSMGLFLGSAAGAWLALRHSGGGVRSAVLRPVTDVLAALAVLAVAYQFFTVDEFSPRLYRGGFLTFDAVVLVAVLCATRPGSITGRVLDMRPTRWLGQRSYSIYMWHWPVCVVTRPGLDVHGPEFVINLLRLVLILALSSLSYRFVEVPLRHGQFGRWRLMQHRAHGRRNTVIAAVWAVGAAAALLLAANPVVAELTVPLHPARPSSGATRPIAPDLLAPTGSAPRPATPSRTPASRTTSSAATPGAPSLSAFGDSVLLGARASLGALTSHLDLDAVVGRQAFDVLDDVAADARAKTLRANVLIHTGDNGIISPGQLKTTLRALRDRSRVLLFTVHVARDWQDPNNATIRSVARHFDNVVVVDWHKIAGAHHGWLSRDGLHLTDAGVSAYARLVLSELRGA